MKWAMLVLMLMFVGGSSAATMYIDTDGSGDYNCDGADDHIEINYAITNASSGDVVHLNASTYTFNATINLASNIIFEGDGQDTAIIKLKDQNNEKNWKLMYGTGITNTTLQNFTHDGNNDGQTGVDQNDCVQGIYLHNSDNITVQYVKSINITTDNFLLSNTDDSAIQCCIANDSWHDGFMLGDCDRITIANNLAWDLGAHGVRFYNTKDSIVENNVFYAGDYGMLISGGGTGLTSGNVYNNNYIENTRFGNFAGIKLNPSDTSTVENETFYNNIIDTATAPGFWTQGSGTVDDIRITNNVFHGCVAGNNGYGIYVETGTNIAVSNNIINNCTLYGIYGNGITSTYNNLYDCGSGAYGGGASVGTGDIAQNPLFVDMAGHDFHINSTNGSWNGTAWVTDAADSPCIDAGNTASDYSNEPSPNGNRINMGAYGNTDEASKSTGTGTPPPINIGHSKSITWVNHTWSAGSGNVTDSYNVSINLTWHNTTTNTYYNNTGLAGSAWSNATVWAFNTTCSELSLSSVSENVQTDSDPTWTPLDTGNYWNTTSVIEITVKPTGLHLFSRTPTQNDNNATASFKMVIT